MEQNLKNGGVIFGPRAEEKAEVERLLADSRFQVSKRNREFLRYLAEARFSGQSTGIKAYAVAVDVFGRPATFDQNSDPIVRIEAVRLRAALDQYYEAFGHETSVRIEIPRGRYLVEFHRTAEIDPALEGSEHFEVKKTPPDETVEVEQRLEALALVFAAIVVLVLAVLFMIHLSLRSGG